ARDRLAATPGSSRGGASVDRELALIEMASVCSRAVVRPARERVSGFACRPPGSTRDVGPVDVAEPGVVLAEEVFPVVIAVRGAHNRVDVVPRWRVVVERDPPLVIELDEQDRTLHPIVEDARSSEVADPAERRRAEVALDLRHLDRGVLRA